MSNICTLHPIDSRLIHSLINEVKGKRSDWNYLQRLWVKKQSINRINQPFKDGLKDLLSDSDVFDIQIHLWGRPFFIVEHEPEKVTAKIDYLYSLKGEKELFQFYLEELRKLSTEAYMKRQEFLIPNKKAKTGLGLETVLNKLRNLYKQKNFEQLGIEIGFVISQLAGVAYPYWHMESYGLTFLESLEIDGWEFTGLGQILLVNTELPELTAYLPTHLNRSLSAGIYIEPNKVKPLLEIIKTNASQLRLRMVGKQFSEKSTLNYLLKLSEALIYSLQHGYGLLEAMDIFESEPKRYP